MKVLRIPERAWAGRWSALTLPLVLLPAFALAWYASSGNLLELAARLDGVALAPAALVAAVACYAAWRINPRPGLAWTSFAVVLLGCQALMTCAVQLVHLPQPVHGGWSLTADLAVALVVLLAATVGAEVDIRPDPAAAGFLIGVVMAVARVWWLQAHPATATHGARWDLTVIAAAAFCAAAAALIRTQSIPRWARWRTAVTIVLIGGSELVLYLGSGGFAWSVAIATNALGAVALVSTSLALFYREVDRDELSRSELNDEVEYSRRAIDGYRARLHQINSTIAGITAASRVLQSPDVIGEERRGPVKTMMYAELDRLARLVSPATDRGAPRVVDLDESVGAMVLAQVAQRRTVRWQPSGLEVVVQPDALAEVLGVLLDNAAVHGRSVTEVCAARVGEIVEIAVSDDGPGIEPGLEKRLFAWGARGSRSTGQGIGLHLARELAQAQGGFLETRDARGNGATFVLGLPASQRGGHEPRRESNGRSLTDGV